MIYFKAWYRRDREGAPVDDRYPDWVVYAIDEDDAKQKVLENMRRAEPERGFRIYLYPFESEDDGTVAFATARQNDQAIL